MDYVDTLALLTAKYPSVWTDDYNSKTSADRRLRQLLKKGSQSGPRQFWDRMTNLLNSIPKDVLPATAADAVKLLSAMHDGIARRDESRINLESAYTAYLAAASSLCTRLSDEDKNKLLEELLLPLVAQYLLPSPETSEWGVPPNCSHIVAKAMTVGTMPTILESTWPNYVNQLINDIKISAPEQSKDYEKSQNALIQKSSRFASLQRQIEKLGDKTQLRSVMENSCLSIVLEALGVTTTRNGKPYGAAGAAAELLHSEQRFVSTNPDFSNNLEEFVSSEIPRLILTPSSSQLVDILYSLPELPAFGPAWAATLKAILEGPDSPRKTKALDALLTSSKVPKSFDLAATDKALQGYIKSSVQEALSGSTEWDAFHHILHSPAKILAAETTDEILSSMTQSLSLTQQAPFALQGLRQIVKQNPSILKDFLSTQQGSKLLQSLLLASESGDEAIAQDAAAVNASIQTVLTAGSDTKQSVYDLVQQGLREATQTSVSVETLVDLAKQLVKPGSSWEELAGVFPDFDDWKEALLPFLKTVPNASLSITNSMGGSVYLVEGQKNPLNQKVPRDSDGYSAAYRIAQYITRVFKDSEFFPIGKVPTDLRRTILRNVALSIQLADDNLGLAGANAFWTEYNADVEADAISFLSDAQAFVVQELKQLQEIWNTSEDQTLLTWAMELLSHIHPEVSPESYNSARAFSVLVAEAVEICGWKSSHTAQIQEVLKTIRRSKGKSAQHELMNFINSL